MAKLKGPLMSMDARGQLGKSLVFLGWKGLKTVRSHVIPANPNTDAQKAQRSLMKAAVGFWHTLQFNAADLEAYRIFASVQAKAMSGFNVFCKKYIFFKVAGYDVALPSGMEIDVGTPGEFSVSLPCSIPLTDIIPAKLRYGSSPTVMDKSVALTRALVGDPYTVTVNGFTADTTVYLQPYTEEYPTQMIAGIYKAHVIPPA
jgi:hypothetical protein